MKTQYLMHWNPDSRWTNGHWTVSIYSLGYHWSLRYNFLSEAVKNPEHLKKEHPDNIEIIYLDPVTKERARLYYRSILEEMFNETNGVFRGV